jgi:hypothetical protein
MSRLDDLLPDQHAALSLLLRQRKTYAEVAALLGIPERAVRDRAHGALAVLAPRQARELTPEQREEIGDYLLGQRAGVAERLQTRTFLIGSAPGRAWGSAISAEIAPLAATPLPEIPPDATPAAAAPGAPAARDGGDQPPAPKPGAKTLPGIHSPASLPSSRRAGALLLAGIAAAVIVIVVLVTNSGGSHARTSAAARSSATGKSTAATAGKATEDKRITLTSPDPASRAIGVAEVLSEGTKYAFYLAAEHLAPSRGFFYAVWLYNSPTSHEALSKTPAVGSNGRLQGGALLPSNAGEYHTMLLTRETSNRPTQPGPVVLSGAFGLH